MSKSIAVLGLGKYGRSLVRALYDLGEDVLAVDREETYVNEISACCTAAVCADLSNEEDLLRLGLTGMDTVVVAMGENLEASILSVAVAKEQGVPMIMAKSSSPRMTSILRKVGADKVIMPEEFAAMRSATLLSSNSVLDYFQVDKSLSMIEMTPLGDWIGKSLVDLSMRKKYKIIVVAIKDDKNHWVPVDPEKPLQEGNKLLVVTDPKNLNRLK